jgi:SAM-dependent methyltransferase
VSEGKSSPSSPSYDAIPEFGMLYDAVPMYNARTDALFYVEEAARTTGRVLELGCGTGRVLIPIARKGRTIVGVDGSREMLARCAEKLAAEPEDVRRRATLHHADLRDFDLGGTFSLAISPFRVFQQVTTIDDQLHFLSAAARHLEPGGRLVLDVFNPSFERLVGWRGDEIEDTPAQRLADGRIFHRTFRVVRVRWVDQVSETELIYYVSPASGAPAVRHVQSFEMRWYLRAELLHLFARSGFRVDALYGNFDRSPLTDSSPEQVVCATRL